MKMPLPEEVLAARHHGDRIDALKVLREKTGLGLKEARYLIEAHAESAGGAASGAGPHPARPGPATPGGLAPGEVRAPSIGVAEAWAASEGSEDMIRRACLALSRAKQAGRNRVEVSPGPASA